MKNEGAARGEKKRQENDVFFSRDDADERGSVGAGSSVQAAQDRKRGPSVLEWLRAEEEAGAEQAAAANKSCWGGYSRGPKLEPKKGTTAHPTGSSRPECNNNEQQQQIIFSTRRWCWTGFRGSLDRPNLPTATCNRVAWGLFTTRAPRTP